MNETTVMHAHHQPQNGSFKTPDYGMRHLAMRNRDLASSRQTDMAWDALILLSGFALFILLVIAYGTGDEYRETHQTIGYATATLVGVGIFWLAVRPYDNQLSLIDFSPRIIKARLRADSAAKNLAPVLLILAALPSCALIIMALTHTVKGVTWVEEIHHVLAYFGIGLVAVYTAMVGIVSGHLVGERVQKIFGRNRHP